MNKLSLQQQKEKGVTLINQHIKAERTITILKEEYDRLVEIESYYFVLLMKIHNNTTPETK